MQKLENMPLLPGATTGRPMTAVTDANDLKAVGVSNTAFGVHVGDKISFDAGEPLVVKQPIRSEANAPIAYYVGCNRNGKDSWVGIGIFTRRDAKNQPIGEIQAKAVNMPNFLEVYSELLAGKTITCDKLIEVETPVFKDGVRTSETQKRMMPNILYV